MLRIGRREKDVLLPPEGWEPAWPSGCVVSPAPPGPRLVRIDWDALDARFRSPFLTAPRFGEVLMAGGAVLSALTGGEHGDIDFFCSKACYRGLLFPPGFDFRRRPRGERTIVDRGTSGPDREILQFILDSEERAIAEVLSNFDLGCCAVGYDGNHLYVHPRALQALLTGWADVAAEYTGTSTPSRCVKYARRGFGIHDPIQTFVRPYEWTLRGQGLPFPEDVLVRCCDAMGVEDRISFLLAASLGWEEFWSMVDALAVREGRDRFFVQTCSTPYLPVVVRMLQRGGIEPKVVRKGVRAALHRRHLRVVEGIVCTYEAPGEGGEVWKLVPIHSERVLRLPRLTRAFLGCLYLRSADEYLWNAEGYDDDGRGAERWYNSGAGTRPQEIARLLREDPGRD